MRFPMKATIYLSHLAKLNILNCCLWIFGVLTLFTYFLMMDFSFLLIVDDFTRYSWLFPCNIKHKSLTPLSSLSLLLRTYIPHQSNLFKQMKAVNFLTDSLPISMRPLILNIGFLVPTLLSRWAL